MESNGLNNRFIYLLTLPTVRPKILQYLSIKDILRLKCVSRRMKLLIDETYLPFELTVIDGSTIFPLHDYGMFEEGLQILLAQTRSLRDLNLFDCDYWLNDKQLINILKSNPYLKYLNINCIGLSPTALHSIIIHGVNVKLLNLIMYKFYSSSLDEIESVDIKFEELRLQVDGANHKYVDRLLQKCEHLRVLNLEIGYCPYDRDAIVLETLRNCKNLKMLQFGGGAFLNDTKIICRFSFLASCKNIESLTLQCTTADAALKALSNLKYLKQLVLKECLRVTEEGIGYITLCENLQILSLHWVKDKVLRRLTHRNLRELYLRKSEITASDIDDIVKRCPSLEVLYVLCRKNKPECFRVLNVVIHIINNNFGYTFDDYCESHWQNMHLKEIYNKFA